MRRLPYDLNGITEGVIWKQLLRFFFPLLFGIFFQQLYNTVDTVIVGRFVGKTALAAVGATGSVVNVTIGLFTGLASGAVVVIAQHYGAQRSEKVSRSVHTSMVMAVVCGLALAAIGVMLTPWALTAMGTPEETLPQAVPYLRIFFIGMVPNAIYNMGTGVLRAIGDSRRPLYFLIAASLCNIVLDIVLVVGFRMGVEGAAIATVASQVLSAVLVVLSLARSVGQPYQLFLRELRPDGRLLKDIIRMGIPAAVQSLMYSSSNIVVQASINVLGTDAVAAWTAISKIDMIFWMSLNAMGMALTTFAGQNCGAGKYERVKQSIKTAYLISCGFIAVLSALACLLAEPLLGVFTTDAAVRAIGKEMLFILAPAYITYISVELMPGVIRGAGKALPPMLISVFGICALRMAWLLLVVPHARTVPMVMACYPITWIVTSTALILYCRFGHWLYPRGIKRLSKVPSE